MIFIEDILRKTRNYDVLRCHSKQKYNNVVRYILSSVLVINCPHQPRNPGGNMGDLEEGPVVLILTDVYVDHYIIKTLQLSYSWD